MRIAYLGPAGTFTEDALGEAASGEFEPLRTATIHDAILAVQSGEADRALVPFENSIEGSVRGTLDALAFEADAVTIVGEHDYAVRAHLIGREPIELTEIEAVLSHQQPLAQCARFLREQLAGVELRSVSSTAAAVRMVAESVRPWAAIGSRAAAELYGCAILREGIQDEADNVTRFVWIAAAGTEPAEGTDLEDLAGLLRAGRRPPRCPRQCAQRVLQPGDQPEPDRVAAAAHQPRPLHVLLRSRRGRRPTSRSRRRSRRSASQGRIGPHPRLLSGRLSEPKTALRGRAAWRPAYNSRQSWLESSYSTQRMSRSTSAR